MDPAAITAKTTMTIDFQALLYTIIINYYSDLQPISNSLIVNYISFNITDCTNLDCWRH